MDAPIGRWKSNLQTAFGIIGIVSSIIFLVSTPLPFVDEVAISFYLKLVILFVGVSLIAINDIYQRLGMKMKAGI